MATHGAVKEGNRLCCSGGRAVLFTLWVAYAAVAQPSMESAVLEAARLAEVAAQQAEDALKRAEEALKQAEEAARKAEEAARQAETKGAEFAHRSVPRRGQGTHDVVAVVVIGDREQVHALDHWADYESSILSGKLSDEDLETVRGHILAGLQEKGYVLAKVDLNRQALSAGFLAYEVDAGDVGTVSVAGNKAYTTRQIADAMKVESGQKFNYQDLYSNLFALNVKPDVEVDVTLNPGKDAGGKRVVDVDLQVRDRTPVHGALMLSNTGSKTTSDWRTRATLQHLNLTKSGDVLSGEWLTDPNELEAVNALALSYTRPLRSGSTLSLFGGWSESDLDDVLTDLDVYGQGHFAGIRFGRTLKSTERYTLEGALGWIYQDVETGLDLANVAFDKKSVRLSMPTFELLYSETQSDRFGGRNYLANTVWLNDGEDWGSSDADTFERHLANADANVFINRTRLARFQRVPRSNWTVFAKLDGQYSSDVLIPALQKTVGGADSVRGYREREVGGDSGVTGTLELRTPLLENVLPGLVRDPAVLAESPDPRAGHRLQLVTFFDFGY
ncbi:MAG: hypothetical protein HOJ57_40640, partial [Lentisphaerae bacterium]|nr:hypothetical protein [Lentisphaerota bacterium]